MGRDPEWLPEHFEEVAGMAAKYQIFIFNLVQVCCQERNNNTDSSLDIQIVIFFEQDLL